MIELSQVMSWLGSTSCSVAPLYHVLGSTGPCASNGMYVSHNHPHHGASQRTLPTVSPSPASSLVDCLAFRQFVKPDCIPKTLETAVDLRRAPPQYNPMTTYQSPRSTADQAEPQEIDKIETEYKCTLFDVRRKLTQNQ